MKKSLVPLALTLTLGLAACGTSEDASHTPDAADFPTVDQRSNGAPGDELDNIALSGSNASLGNTL